jgi:hypothetical protein
MPIPSVKMIPHCFLLHISTIVGLQFHRLQLAQKTLALKMFLRQKKPRRRQKLTNFFLDNAPNDSNKRTMVSDTHFNSVPMPLLPNATCGINTNINNASRVRNSSKNGQKMIDSTTDDSSTNPNNNTPLSPEPLDIDMDDQTMLAPSHMKRAHSTQNTKKQIDIRTFGIHLKGQSNANI